MPRSIPSNPGRHKPRGRREERATSGSLQWRDQSGVRGMKPTPPALHPPPPVPLKPSFLPLFVLLYLPKQTHPPVQRKTHGGGLYHGAEQMVQRTAAGSHLQSVCTSTSTTDATTVDTHQANILDECISATAGQKNNVLVLEATLHLNCSHRRGECNV